MLGRDNLNIICNYEDISIELTWKNTLKATDSNALLHFYQNTTFSIDFNEYCDV